MPPAPPPPSRLTAALARVAHGLAAADAAGRLSPGLLLGDLGAAAGLAFAQDAFLPGRPPAPTSLLVPAVMVAALGWLRGGHELRRRGPGRLLARGAGVACGAALGLLLLRAAGAYGASAGQCVWLAAAAGILAAGLRAAHLAARAAWPDQPGEIVRALAVAAATGALVAPFWTADSLGAGDAQWYTLMLADFTAQWRSGVFPVWVGQSIYAFNGAVTPLRVAPWLQHWGGGLDLLTAHALGPVALINATLVTAALAGGLAAYAALRAITGRRPWLAALLALLWMASPGVLAPLMAGDQYMTFMTLPFVAAVLYGVWRCWTRDDRPARVAVAAGLAGLWLSHTPVALWMGLLAGAHYAAKVIVRRTWRLEVRRVAGMAATFLVLGAFPLLSVLALDNLNPVRTTGAAVPREIARVFPANFLPIAVHRNALTTYQLGYAALGAFVLTAVLLATFRPRGAAPLALTALLIAPFAVPVPGLTAVIWRHLPDWFATINNIWPMQRLFLIWAAVIFFGLAAVAADARFGVRRARHAAIVLLLLVGAAWSWHEARRLAAFIDVTRLPVKEQRLLRPNNVLVSRYAYASFARTPAYFSTGYMDPALENRLLARDTLRVMVADADVAAPRLAFDDGRGTAEFPRLVQSGVFTAANDNHTDFYNLSPALTLQPDRTYALRLDFLQAGEHGVLQIMDPRLFREYYLPDSGQQMAPPGTSRAFGSEPQSGRVIPLRVPGPGPATPRLYFITPRRATPAFAFARFSLFTYDPDQLPVAVESWVPYRARVRTAVPAWLETPRVWQGAWRAEVNGRPEATRRSPQDLVMVPVEPGDSQVMLRYVPPWWLRADYWLSLAGWALLGLLAAARLVRHAARAAAA